MALTARVWRVGKRVLIVGALLTTYVVSAALAARVALRLREVTVPTLLGNSVSAATVSAVQAGLTLRVDESRRVDPRTAAGHVAQQDPPAGSVARRGRSVRVWLSSGPAAATVPRLIGETERTAQLRLQQDGLSLASVSEIHSNEETADAVVAQDPPPGTRSGSVSLLVNRRDRAVAYVMPDLIGVHGGRVADLLRTAGFRVAVVAQQPYPGIPAGVVIRQSPQAGFQVTREDTVSLEVSR